MFVQSERFIEEHGGRIGDISVYGQESNYTTWRLAKMNLAIRGIDANIAHGDTFHAARSADVLDAESNEPARRPHLNMKEAAAAAAARLGAFARRRSTGHAGHLVALKKATHQSVLRPLKLSSFVPGTALGRIDLSQ